MKTDIHTLADLISRRGHDALAAEFEAAVTPLAEAIEREEFPITPRAEVNEAELLKALNDLSKLACPASWAMYPREMKLKLSDVSLPDGMTPEEWRDKVWYGINSHMHAGYDWASSDPISGGQHFHEFLYQWFFRGRFAGDRFEEAKTMSGYFEDAFNLGLPVRDWIEKCAPENIAAMYPGSRDYWFCLRKTALYLGYFAMMGDAPAVSALAKLVRLLPGVVVLGSDEVHYWHVTCGR